MQSLAYTMGRRGIPRSQYLPCNPLSHLGFVLGIKRSCENGAMKNRKRRQLNSDSFMTPAALFLRSILLSCLKQPISPRSSDERFTAKPRAVKFPPSAAWRLSRKASMQDKEVRCQVRTEIQVLEPLRELRQFQVDPAFFGEPHW